MVKIQLNQMFSLLVDRFAHISIGQTIILQICGFWLGVRVFIHQLKKKKYSESYSNNFIIAVVDFAVLIRLYINTVYQVLLRLRSGNIGQFMNNEWHQAI